MLHIRTVIFSSFLFLMCGLVSATATQLEPRLNASPRVGFDNTGVVVEAIIPRDSRNRRMRLEVDGPKFRAFEEDMDGADARVIYRLVVENLPEGDYTITMVVLREDGTTWIRRTTICRGTSCVQEVPE